MTEKVILVDMNDRQTGLMDKTEAHRKALLHRAVSAFIFNSKNQLLLQRRALNKYHSAGLWTNTACTHPRPGESPLEAAQRRLEEEMGLKVNDLTKLFDFVYKEPLENGLTEHEYDHVFAGISDDLPVPEPGEVCDYRYVGIDTVTDAVRHNPDEYTIWFRHIIERVIREIHGKIR